MFDETWEFTSVTSVTVNKTNCTHPVLCYARPSIKNNPRFNANSTAISPNGV